MLTDGVFEQGRSGRDPSRLNATLASLRLVGWLLVPVKSTPLFISDCTSPHMARGRPKICGLPHQPGFVWIPIQTHIPLPVDTRLIVRNSGTVGVCTHADLC